MIVCFPVEKKIKMDWAQPMVYSEEFSRKERPTIDEYMILHMMNRRMKKIRIYLIFS